MMRKGKGAEVTNPHNAVGGQQRRSRKG